MCLSLFTLLLRFRNASTTPPFASPIFLFLCGRRRRFRQGHFLPDVLLKLHNTVTQLRGPLKFPLSTGTRTFPSGKAMVS